MTVRALIATLGFDERHVIKSLIDIGMSNVYKIVLLVPNWGLDERTEKAIKTIRDIAKYAGLSSEKSIVIKEINVLDLWSGIKDILKTLHDLYIEGVDEYIISLGGGLRILVVETLLASLIVNKDIADRISIRVSVENRSDSVSFKVNTVPICIEIDSVERKILETLFHGYKSLSQISDETNIPKSTVWKIIQRLKSKNIVNVSNKKYEITDLGKVLLRIK